MIRVQTIIGLAIGAGLGASCMAAQVYGSQCAFLIVVSFVAACGLILAEVLDNA